MEALLPTIIDTGPGVLAILFLIVAVVKWRDLDHDARCWAMFGVMATTLTWAFMNSFQKVFEAWESPQYSHGYLIPVFTVGLLYLKRQSFPKLIPTWQQGVGLAIVLVAVLLRMFFGKRAVMTPDRVMFVPALIGIMLIIGGLRTLKWSVLPLLFLGFMYPFPSFVERGLLFPLKSFSTQVSHFALETLGVECFTDGNRIVLDSVEMGVVDACSGLRMFTIFLALAFGIAMVTTRPIWEKIAIFFCAVPISLAVNSIRITLTGLAYHFLGAEGDLVRIVTTVLHDFAGWIMMPMALGLLYLAYYVLSNIVIEEKPKQLSPIGV